MDGTNDHYRRPGWFTKNVFNNVVAIATRLGLSVWGSRVLEVRGRLGSALTQRIHRTLPTGAARLQNLPMARASCELRTTESSSSASSEPGST